jgi:ABC-2 type transport system ATP-binding protein
VIEVSQLTFDYPRNRALEEVSLSVSANSITALVGPNGAGKTTLLRCLAGLEMPLAGSIEVAGVDVLTDSRHAHERLGYLSDFYGLYDRLSVAQCLDHHAAIRGVAKARRSEAIAGTLERLGLADRLTDKAGTLSRGLRQRLAIAQAIIHQPQVVLLDEPASGLDPEARIALAAVLRELRDEGMTLVVSSHILAELEDYSTHLLILDGGRVVEHRALEGLAEGQRSVMLRLEFSRPVADFSDRLAGLEGTSELRCEGKVALLRGPAEASEREALLARIVAEGLPLCGLAIDEESLQETYIARLQSLRSERAGR